jgi:hypothetical protein
VITPTADRARLATEVLCAYVDVRRRLRRSDFQTVVRELRSSERRASGEPTDPHRLGRAVARTLKVVPADSRCLMQSLVLTELLARRGVHSSLVIGVAPGPEFKAHAWVEAAGSPLLPSLEPLYERFAEV